MEEKQFDPARQNTVSPAPGMAAVNTHNPGEETEEETVRERAAQGDTDLVKSGQQDEQIIERDSKGKEETKEAE